MAGLVGLSAQESRDLRTVFDAYDSSSTGRISDINDLRKCLRVLGFRCSRHRLQQLISDQQARGGVDFAGFTQVIMILQGTDYDVHEELHEAFTLMDASDDGQLSLDDLHTASREAGLRLTVAELQAMIDEADKDGDGLVSRDEFISTMLKTALFS